MVVGSSRKPTTPVAVVGALLLLVGALLPASGCKDADGRRKAKGTPVKGRPYQVEPMLRSLRPGEAKRIAKQLGVKDLGQLPFYDIALEIDPAAARVKGKTIIYFPNRTRRALRSIPLLLYANAPRELSGKTSDSGALKLLAARSRRGPEVKLRSKRPTLAELQLERPLRRGAWLVAEVRFEGELRRLPASANDIYGQALSSLGVAAGGPGASDYGLLAIGDGIATVASAYPMVAPFRGGAFDTARPTKFGDLAYNVPSNFRVQTTLPRGWSMASNLLDGKPRALSGGDRIAVRSAGAAARDMVLVAAHDLEKSSRKLGDITVTSYYRAGDEAAGKSVLDTAVASLKLYQRRFGRYPYRELATAQATLVGGAGGVEFPGLVLIAGMFYRPPSRSTNPLALLTRLLGGVGGLLGGGAGGSAGGGTGGSAGGVVGHVGSIDRVVDRMREFVVAHEVAHQYFAGVVGSDCRRYPAVDEPLAQFAAGELVRELHGDKQGERLMALNVKANYGVYRMLGGADMEAGRPVAEFPNALAYAAIVYGKAPYYYVALRERLGAKRFDKALRAAVARNRFRLVTLSDWLDSLQRAAGGASVVGSLGRRYFHGKHGDEDLGVDGSGRQVLGMLLGPKVYTQLQGGLKMLGVSPQALFRMLMSASGNKPKSLRR